MSTLTINIIGISITLLFIALWVLTPNQEGESSRRFTIIYTKNHTPYMRHAKRKLFESFDEMMEREGFGKDYKGRLEIHDRWVYLEMDEG